MLMRFEHIPTVALDWHDAGRGAALATVVETWGSAPRPTGSQMAISGDGEIAGSVSGGCVEGAVLLEAQDAIQEGGARLLEFGVSDDDAFAVGLACGGRILVLVEPVADGDLAPGLLAELVSARQARRAVAYEVTLDDFSRRIVAPPAHGERFRADRSGVLEDGRSFVAIHNPPLRMAVIGGVHIAQTLIPMAGSLGFDVTLIDPRDSFASEVRFPGVTIRHDWPDEALADHGLDPRTAVITLTHDPKIDDPALIAALRSEVFYIGSLGSTRTHGKRLERMRQEGIAETQLSRIHGPIGLDIGARSPAEIAVSIVAEVVQVLRSG
ncbi:XdhC family protein [Palleronia caenipelagi]|uniref:XdhC family protein n=1 Tax=Palleronia caenipelagi TaxID=2489174 RepID=A0A547QAV0_9RHOB|nr:XdhC family protein [Palleronia caenipelagi]TRD23504.1 XdhC family protein [Palleronia caenipelagi]